jgi:hypothetical protein
MRMVVWCMSSYIPRGLILFAVSVFICGFTVSFPHCPVYQVEVNAETGQTILSGMGELHLEIIHSRLVKEYNVEADLGPLQVAYRETITTPVQQVEVTHG